MKILKINTFKVFLFALSTVLVLSCEKEKDNDRAKPYPYNDPGFYIVNEGNFTWGNGSLSFFSFDSLKIYNEIFSTVSGMPLGDIPVRAKKHQTRLYNIVNNSDKIEILDINSGTYYGNIEGLISPRDMVFLGAGKALVSSLYSDSLTLVNIFNQNILSYINIGCSSECLLVKDDKIFVSNWSGGNKIIVLNKDNYSRIKTITVAKEPAEMYIDKAGNLRVLCSGGYMNDEFPAIYSIDTESLEILSSITFNTKECSPSELVINASLDTLYYLNKDIYRIAYNATTVPEDSFIKAGQRNFYRLGYYRARNRLIVSDAVDYVQKGYIYLYSPDGTEIFNGKSDIIPGKIAY